MNFGRSISPRYGECALQTGKHSRAANEKWVAIQFGTMTGLMSVVGHFRQINDVCAMSAFHPIATDLLHHGEVT